MTIRAFRRRTAATVGLVLLTAAVAGAQTEPEACSVPGQVVTEPDGWTRIRAPQFGVGPRELVAYAVDPIQPERFFATNGKMVKRSTDGGCTWTTVVSIPSVPSVEFPFPSQTTFHSIEISAAASSSGRFHYLVLREDFGNGVVRPGVLRSNDGGDIWERRLLSYDAEPGELLLGNPVELVVPEASPDTVYLATSAAGRGTLVYVSHDAGAGWLPAFLGGNEPPPQFVASDLGVDPLEPERVWAGGGPQRLWHSNDGGARWVQKSVVQVPDQPVTAVDVFRTDGKLARIWVVGRPYGSSRSLDGGQTWQQMPGMPGGLLDPSSSAHGATAEDLFVVADAENGSWALGWSEAAGDWQVLKKSFLPLRDASADRASTPSYYARTSDRIYRSPAFSQGFQPPGFEGDVLEPPEPPPPNPWTPDPTDPSVTARCPTDSDPGAVPDPPSLDDSVLTPQGITVTLAPGESRVVPYELQLPGAARVDVYFLMDASGSMGPFLCGAANSSAEIAKRLIQSGIDAWFGVGTYQSLPAGDCVGYKRWVDISPVENFFVPSGTCGGREPQMSALVQAALGTGQPDIAPNQQANFRTGGIPVIVHVSDEPQTVGPEHATINDAIEALNHKGIGQVGIVPDDIPVPSPDIDPPELPAGPPASIWVRQVARQTGAIAVEPVDCEGDGLNDIQPGDPLVCGLSSTRGTRGVAMADAVAGMVLALAGEDATARLEVTAGNQVVAGIDPAEHSGLDLRKINDLPFDVTYRCRLDQAGQTIPVDLAAKVGSQTVATASALVTCTKPGVPPINPPIDLPANPAEDPPVAAIPIPPIPPPLLPPPPALVPGPAPAPNPAPAPGPAPAPAPAPGAQPQPQANPQANPQPNPQSQPQSQSQTQSQAQVQVQAGLAAQEQEQPQTALAQAQQTVSEDEEFAMSTRRRSYPVPPLTVLGGGAVLALGLSVCFGLARGGARPAHARTKERRRHNP